MAMSRTLIEKLKERIASGIAFMAGAYANEWVTERLARKYLKEYGELGTGLGVAIALDALGIKEKVGEYEPYLDMIADAMSDYGFYESVLKAKVVKAPKCFFTDANTIHCINFDVDTLKDANGTYVTVYIDDASAAVSDVTGGPGSFDIALSSPAAKGWHKLVVVAGNNKKDVFRGKAYTP